MFHLAAYTGLIGQTALTDIAALVDDIWTIQNNHFILSQNVQLMAAAVMSANLQRAKLASPTMRQIAAPYIRPIIGAATPGNNANVFIVDYDPFTLVPYEEIQLQATSSLAMGTEQLTALLWAQYTADPLPMGNPIPLNFTSTTTATANKWTTITYTLTDTLPSGVYTIFGSECQSTNGIAHRWIISNQVPRPGMLSFTALSQRLPYALAKGQLGAWGRFRSNDLPRLQVLCNGADAAHEGQLWVVRTGNLS